MSLNFIDHIVMIVKDLKKSENFYSIFLGKPVQRDKYSVCFKVGKTRLFIGSPYKKVGSYKAQKDKMGLNHMAFGLKSVAELNKFEICTA